MRGLIADDEASVLVLDVEGGEVFRFSIADGHAGGVALDVADVAEGIDDDTVEGLHGRAGIGFGDFRVGDGLVHSHVAAGGEHCCGHQADGDDSFSVHDFTFLLFVYSFDA